MRSRLRGFALLLLAGALQLAARPGAANPRAPPPQWEDPEGPPAEPDVWLRRLVGNYRFEGLADVVYDGENYPELRCAPMPPPGNDMPPIAPGPHCSTIKGAGDCVRIGAGPGVHCIFNVTWLDLYEGGGMYNLPGGVSYLSPAMLLFGLDPGKSAISYLLVDNKGLPEGGPGFITGNRGTFRTTCVNGPSLFLAMKPAPRERLEGPPRTCDRILRIEARDDASLVRLSMEIEINDELWTRHEMSLYRVAPTPRKTADERQR